MKDIDPERISIIETSYLLNSDQSYVYRLFREGKIKNYNINKKPFTTKGDIIEYLQTKVPAGFAVIEACDNVVLS